MSPYVPTWRPIPGFYGYEVSECGVVRSWRKVGAGGRGKLTNRPKYLSEQARGYRMTNSLGESRYRPTQLLILESHGKLQ